jgi:hypothetical protein
VSDGGPAYPIKGYCADASGALCGEVIKHCGMSLRDWFAGQALVMLPHHGCGADLGTEETALAAYQIADEMLKAREGKP